MQTNVIEVPAETLPEIGPTQSWSCENGCGECKPKQIDFEYARTEDPPGTVTERKVGKIWVSECCEADLMLWDEGKQNFVDFKMGGGLVLFPEKQNG